MKSSFFGLVLAAALFAAPAGADAVSSATIYIQGPGDSVLVNSPITFPEDCTVSDDGGNPHDFTGHKAVCAIHEAREQGLISSYEFIDFGPGLGLFLNAVNGIATAPDWSESWQAYKNGESALVGVGELVISTCSVLQLTYGPWPTAIVAEAAGCEPEGGALSVNLVSQSLNLLDATDFLLSQQKEDGSFGAPLFSDWAAVALGAVNRNHEAAAALANYLIANPDPAASLGSPVLSFERRAMALMALGLNPYTAADINYVEVVADSFDGTQLGDKGLVNDDIFGLLVLTQARYQDAGLIDSVARFIVSSQSEEGSFGEVDMTAAGIQALTTVPQTEEVQESIGKAVEYLKEQQGEDGGFGNPDSTSWAMQAMASLGHFPWEKNNSLPPEFLASFQEEDGGISGSSEELRTWSTSYAIAASQWKSWPEILLDVEEPLGAVEGETFVERVVLPQDGLSGKLVIPNILETTAQGAWDGGIEFVPAASQEEVETMTEDLSFLGPVGIAQVSAGEGVSLSFQTPAKLSIPVFVLEGEELHVYVSSEPDSGFFAYLASCTVQDGLCGVDAPHFSTFVAAREKTTASGTARHLAAGLELEQTKTELQALRQELASLRTQLASLRTETALAQAQLVQEQEPAAQEEQENEEPSDSDNEQLTASVAGGTTGGFFSSGAGQGLAALVIGGALFALLGGWRNVAPLFRRRPSPARYEPPVFTGRYEGEASL